MFNACPQANEIIRLPKTVHRPHLNRLSKALTSCAQQRLGPIVTGISNCLMRTKLLIACMQVAVVEVLAQEGTLHLLPPSARAPGGREAYTANQRPEAFSKLLGRLYQEGFLKKSMEHSSMVLDLVPAEAKQAGHEYPEAPSKLLVGM